MDEALFYFGDTLKALDDKGRVGGYAVRFTDSDHRDLYGDYFTKDTYLGAHEGDGVDVLFHHGMPLYTSRRMTDQQKQAFEAFRNHIFSPAKSKKDDVGLFTEVVLDMADEYERAVFGLVKAGKLGWSSGSTWHMVKRTDDGEITRWPIIEISMTPQPAEPLNRVATLKSIQSLKFHPLDDESEEIPNQTAISDAEQQVSSFGDLDMETHFRLTVSAIRGFTSRLQEHLVVRQKAGRILSENDRQRRDLLIKEWEAVSVPLKALREESAAINDAEKRATETEHFMAKARRRGEIP